MLSNLLFDPRHDTLDGYCEIVEGNVIGLSPGRGNGSLIDQIRDIGASEAGSQACDLVQIDILANPDLPDMQSCRGLRPGP